MSYDIAMTAIAAGILVAGSFASGYYTGRKDQTPSDRTPK